MSGYSEASRRRVERLLEDGIESPKELSKRTRLSISVVKKIKHDLQTEKEPSDEAPREAPDQAPGNEVEEMDQGASSTVEEIDKTEGSQKGSRSGLRDARDLKIAELEARVAALTQSNQAAAAAAARGTVAGESVAGRPSLASFREETWKRLAGTVISLPSTALRLGRERTIELVAGTLQADLAVLALGAPTTPLMAKMRVAVEHCVSDRAKLAVMMGNDVAGRQMRTIFLRSAVKFYFSPSVQQLFSKSIETLLPSQMGMEMG